MYSVVPNDFDPIYFLTNGTRVFRKPSALLLTSTEWALYTGSLRREEDANDPTWEQRVLLPRCLDLSLIPEQLRARITKTRIPWLCWIEVLEDVRRGFLRRDHAMRLRSSSEEKGSGSGRWWIVSTPNCPTCDHDDNAVDMFAAMEVAND